MKRSTIDRSANPTLPAHPAPREEPNLILFPASGSGIHCLVPGARWRLPSPSSTPFPRKNRLPVAHKDVDRTTPRQINTLFGDESATPYMPSTNIGFDVVREIALALPGVEESSLHGAPSLKVSGRLLACPALHKSAEPNSLVVRVGFDQRAKLMEDEPSVYYVTHHYVNYPMVLVRLRQINRNSLRDLLGMAWHFASSKTKTNRRAPRRGHDG